MRQDNNEGSEGHTHHLTSYFLWDVCFQVETELNGFVVFMLSFQLLGILNPQPQSQGGIQPIVLFCQLHPESGVLGKEGMIQEVFDGQSDSKIGEVTDNLRNPMAETS